MTTNRKPDWAKIEAEYVYGGPGVSYRSLARKHGLDQATVAKKGRADGWVGKRQAEGKQKASAIKKGAEVEVLATAEEDGRQIVRDSKELATACLELAKDGLSRARDAENAGDFRNYVIAACAATDKWRLLTDQSTHISETRNGDQRTDEEILEDLEDYAAIFKERAARRGAGT